MSRTALPFVADDISAVAKSLRAQLAGRDHAPSHVELLNMLARASGHRNFQHLRASTLAHGRLQQEAPAPTADHALVERVAGHFDRAGRLVRWPAKTSHQTLCLWALWARLPAEVTLTEAQINRELQALHHFGDHAILRRSLCTLGLLWRTRDGRSYRRVERPPGPEAAALIRHLKARA